MNVPKALENPSRFLAQTEQVLVITGDNFRAEADAEAAERVRDVDLVLVSADACGAGT